MNDVHFSSKTNECRVCKNISVGSFCGLFLCSKHHPGIYPTGQDVKKYIYYILNNKSHQTAQ